MQEEKTINGYPFIRYQGIEFTETETTRQSEEFFRQMQTRRSVRDISDRPVPYQVIENLVKTASSAPSGANKQPWTFCIVRDPAVKKSIREAAEKEEYESYQHRMSEEWLADLKPLQTDWNKPFLEKAPYLIIVFKHVYEKGEDGAKKNNYYVNESVGLACGFLLAAIHNAGLVSLTHTPSPMNFLTKILNRPENERPFLLIPVGYAEKDTFVPKISRKSFDEIAKLY
ncbi:nitroreductase family protein [Fulvivirga sedimenti]|uniref:Nitroreductase family protein n=1 Tax=Fulvivirga sedimenti TaxID=2879465 RepID=A0A9X1HK19_9BACT|nr:nitroreductase family protein [Fulvivirga sedimenti]MCA6073558.1 nitroreductase family protein [Fulvivirga sedimenti]